MYAFGWPVADGIAMSPFSSADALRNDAKPNALTLEPLSAELFRCGAAGEANVDEPGVDIDVGGRCVRNAGDGLGVVRIDGALEAVTAPPVVVVGFGVGGFGVDGLELSGGCDGILKLAFLKL